MVIKMKEINEIVKNVKEEEVDKIDWTNAWSKKYPIIATYQKEVDIKEYSSQIRKMLEELKKEYQYNELDAMLVLKDILYHEWKNGKKEK